MKLNLGISIKLMSMALFAVLCFILISAISLTQLRATMMDDRAEKLKNINEIGRGVITSFYNRAKSGEMDEAAAKQMAMGALRTARFGNGEYFLVYRSNGIAVVNGARPESEGTDRINVKDSKGVMLVQEMLKAAAAGGGVVMYEFPRAGSTVPIPKMAYALPFQPWDWVLTTGIYVDDVDAAFLDSALRFAMVLGGVMVALVLLVLALSRNIGGGVNRLVTVAERLAARDFTVVVPATDRKDEIGKLAKAITLLRDAAAEAEDLRDQQETLRTRSAEERHATMLSLADNFEGSVQRVADTITTAADKLEGAASSVNGAIGTASQRSTAIAAAAEEASTNVATVATAAEELSASILEISRQVQQSSAIATEAVNEAQRTDTLVRGLAESATRIGTVIGLINDIASQTNLLALNATIEAARAGDAGKGFAVVAGEVKTLANQTAKATGDISSQVNEVQAATEQAVQAIHAITATIQRISEITNTIAAAVEEQGAATSEIARNVQQASAGTQEVTQTLGQLTQATTEAGTSAGGMLSACQAMVGETEKLRQEMSGFLAIIRN